MFITRVTECKSTREFLDTLREHQLGQPVNENFFDIYRGVGDSVSHALVPNALREDECSRHRFMEVSRYGAGVWENSRQAWAEINILTDFYLAADRSSRTLPAIPEHIDVFFKTPDVVSYDPAWSEVVKSWPPTSVLPILALAQHYGLPTRLLDWSTDPYISAYFAADSCINEIGKNKSISHNLAVWVVNTKLFDAIFSNPKRKFHARLVRPPYFQNTNLSAQKGLFSLVVPSNDSADDLYKPLDKFVLDKLQGMPSNDPAINAFYSGGSEEIEVFHKIELNAAHAPSLMKDLISLDKDPSKLFPGFDGVAKLINLKGKLLKLERQIYEMK